jgi:hypothetical protein
MMTTPVCDSKSPILVLSALVSCDRAAKASEQMAAIRTRQMLRMVSSVQKCWFLGFWFTLQHW